MEETILVQHHSTGRVKFIILTLDSATISRKWGLISGKTQSTSHIYDYTNKGKSNELSPEETARADYERIIDTRIKEGLQVTNSLTELPDLGNNKMNFENLPAQFCCSKPYTSISKTKCNKLIKAARIRFFIKYNGLCSYILITGTGEVKIYTRRLDDCTVKYSTIVEAVKKLMYPPHTLLIVELVVDPCLNIPHMEGFKLISSISRSDTLKGKVKDNIEKTLALQEETPVKAVVFNILFYHGDDLTKLSYNDVFETYLPVLNNKVIQDILIAPTELEFSSYDEAYKWSKDNHKMYEGLVIWEKESNAKITYTGKPKRTACFKLKSIKEDDVVAYDWKEGTGAKQGKVGSLCIGKYNAEGEMIPMGNVGSGLKIKEGECEIDYWNLPCVIEISYDQRFPTGKYQFPRFTGKIHLEKIPSDIVIDENGF